jgi:hypothetical protein
MSWYECKMSSTRWRAFIGGWGVKLECFEKFCLIFLDLMVKAATF